METKTADSFHYERRKTESPLALYFDNKGIWVNAHEDFEILYVVEGRIRLCADDTQLTVCAGEAVILNPHCVHAGFLDPGTKHWAILCRDQLSLREASHPILCVFDRIGQGELCFDLRVLTKENDPEVMDILRRLSEVHGNPSPYWRLESVSLFYAFAAAALRCGILHEPSPDKVSGTSQKNDIALYLDFAKYVSRAYAEDITVKSTAAVLGISESKLYKVCRAVQGQTPVEYILDYRLDRAAVLLRTGGSSVTEIALACGFGSVSYFISRFRSKYGITPKQFCASCTEK